MSHAVVDASVAVTLGLPDEDSGFAEEVFARVREDGAIVPAVWPIEIANIHTVAVRRGRISRDEADEAAGALLELPIFISHTTLAYGLLEIHPIALDTDLSAYDACYLDLALRRGLPLATLDKPLRRAARARGV